MSHDHHWQATEEFYRRHLDEGSGVPLMLQLVQWLRKSKYAKEVCPSTSHFSLILSFSDEYRDIVKMPAVAAEEVGNGMFSLTYYPSGIGKTHDLEKFSVPMTGIQNLIESLFIRMAHESTQSQSE